MEASDTAGPKEVAPVLHTSVAGLAQWRYRGVGPKFIKTDGGGAIWSPRC